MSKEQKQRVLVSQTLFKARHDPFAVTEINVADLTESHIAQLLQSAVDGVLGIASSHGPKGVLTSVAIATPKEVLYIRMNGTPAKAKAKKKGGKKAASSWRELLGTGILCHPDYCKLAFDMHSIAVALHVDHGLAITRAIDLQSMLTSHRQAPKTLLQILGGEAQLHKEKVLDAFRGEAFDSGNMRNVCLRAWASGRVGFIPHLKSQLSAVPPIDTHTINQQHLYRFAKFIRDAERLYALKPTKIKNDVAAEFGQKSGALNVEMTRFKTRLRTSQFHNQQLVVEFKDAKAQSGSEAAGRVVKTSGKSATMTVDTKVSATAQISAIYTIGKEDPTYADQERLSVSIRVLQQRAQLFEHPIVRKILAPTPSYVASHIDAATSLSTAISFSYILNSTQMEAVVKILSGDLTLIHGPPGTGKTTVIAAVVTSLKSSPTNKEGVWLVAQSNVAVKNIAEKLAKIDFWDFKVLVSKDFHFEWHEHLYEKIERNVIRSDEFADNEVGTERLLLGSQVILCTLSMMSHPRLPTSGFTRIVPVNTVIVDEASQIELGDYLPLFSCFGKTIRRIAFIGDDKQLAPYGQDDLGDLPSIFELDHLRNTAVFLDTQYRMPAPIGNFISKHVYEGKLKTSHHMTSPLSCRLVDVLAGKERKVSGSWVNDAEAFFVVAIARILHSQGKLFRIITPYDAQRNLLEKNLKASKLPWENKCFNVDSFQGNEEDHIIISVVRSEKVGFLTNIRRTNVMLSRCKESMIICTSRAFLEQKASKSLIAKLAAEWGQSSWIPTKNIMAGKL